MGGAEAFGQGEKPTRYFVRFEGSVIGLRERASQVLYRGVKIGQVASVELDDFLRARVRMEIDARIELPVDSSAGIRTAGLLGDQFIALEPGAEDELLTSGEELSFTEDALSIERLIGKFVNNAGLDDE